MSLIYNTPSAVTNRPRVGLMPKKVAEWWEGKRLRNLRIAEKWSQGDLAKKMGITIQAISRWERNDDAPNRDRIAELHALFGASADYWYGFVDLPYEHIEEKKLKPDEQELLRIYRAGQLPAVLGQILLSNLGSNQDKFPLIGNEGEDSTASQNKTSDR